MTHICFVKCLNHSNNQMPACKLLLKLLLKLFKWTFQVYVWIPNVNYYNYKTHRTMWMVHFFSLQHSYNKGEPHRFMNVNYSCVILGVPSKIIAPNLWFIKPQSCLPRLQHPCDPMNAWHALTNLHCIISQDIVVTSLYLVVNILE